MSSLALTVPFPDNKFASKLDPRVPNSIDKKPPLCSFVSFLIVLVTTFKKYQNPLRLKQFSSHHSFLLLKLLKLLFQNQISFFVFLHPLLLLLLILMGLKHF